MTSAIQHRNSRPFTAGCSHFSSHRTLQQLGPFSAQAYSSMRCCRLSCRSVRALPQRDWACVWRCPAGRLPRCSEDVGLTPRWGWADCPDTGKRGQGGQAQHRVPRALPMLAPLLPLGYGLVNATPLDELKRSSLRCLHTTGMEGILLAIDLP